MKNMNELSKAEWNKVEKMERQLIKNQKKREALTLTMMKLSGRKDFHEHDSDAKKKVSQLTAQVNRLEVKRNALERRLRGVFR